LKEDEASIAVSRWPHASGPPGNPTLLERTSEEDYRLQYREYVRKLETVAKDPTTLEPIHFDQTLDQTSKPKYLLPSLRSSDPTLVYILGT
jgi:hypothetical protein